MHSQRGFLLALLSLSQLESRLELQSLLLSA
jgi:hypothetical protein